MSVLLERETQVLEQRPALVVVGRRGHDRDVHAAAAVDAVLVDLVEHDLLGETEGVVAVAVELPRRQAAEVTDTGQRQRQQPVQELPHPVAAQRDVRADRHALAQLELRDGLAGLGDLRLLAGDRGQVLDGPVDQLGVLGRVADAHVHHDLGEPGDLVDVLVAELLAQPRDDLLAVARLEARRGRRLDGGLGGLGAHQMSLPERLATRTRTVLVRPSRSICSLRYPTRVPFLVSGSTSMTLLMWIGVSMVSMPPVRLPRCDCPTLTCFVTRWTPSTTTRCVSVRTSSTRPCLPRSRPEMTTTRSPFLIFAMVRAPPAPAR